MKKLCFDICKNKILLTNFVGSVVWSFIFIIPVLLLSLTLKNKNTALAKNLLNELQAPTILSFFPPLYILASSLILGIAIKKQNKNIVKLQDFWFYKLQIDKFFLFSNITLFSMLISTTFSKYTVNSELDFSYPTALAILGNYIVIAFFPLTFSEQAKEFKTWRCILSLIFLVSQAPAFATGAGIFSEIFGIIIAILINILN